MVTRRRAKTGRVRKPRVTRKARPEKRPSTAARVKYLNARGDFVVPRKTMVGLLGLIDNLDSLVDATPAKRKALAINVSWRKRRYCCKFNPVVDPYTGETTFDCWNHRSYPLNADLRCVAHALQRGSSYATNARGRCPDEGCRE